MAKTDNILLKKELRSSVKNRIRGALQAGTLFSSADRRRFLANLFSLAVLKQSTSVMVYLNLPEELPTTEWLELLFHNSNGEEERPDRLVIIPWCQEQDLRLFRLTPPKLGQTGKYYPEEVVPGTYNILEPDLRYRECPERQFRPEDLDLVLVPGVAFDRLGGRLGHGAGYYDRFFQKISPCCTLVGLAFEMQIVDSVPLEPHDRRMNYIVTPQKIYRI